MNFVFMVPPIAANGFYMPAEWDDHEATWIGWPHNRSDWPGKFSPVPWAYAEIVRKLTQGEIARILVESKSHEEKARTILRKTGVDLSRVEFFRIPTNRGWTRDFGPIFVKKRSGSEVAIVRFGFNAWAKYPDWKKDSRVASRAARRLGLQLFSAQISDRGFILEGGALDVNGKGTLITTEECLLDQEVQCRNLGMPREVVEAALSHSLGISNVIWLGKGIEGDDTHGHVDDICRFVNSRTVVLCRETNGADYNHRVLEENRERLQSATLEDGAKPEIAFLPMPAPLSFKNRRLPASYANFYISNSAVLVPTFNDPSDRTALGILAELITDRPVVGIHAVDLVWGLGTLHCLTQQQPQR